MKKQIFTSQQHQQFKTYFGIKDNPGKWDITYMNKAKKYMKYISWIPGVMMIGIGNSMAMNSAKQSSDIDLYIVTKNTSMWTVRILVTLIFQALGVRKTASQHAGCFCLSFFSTLDGMDFSKFALPHDPYLFFWMLYFKPLYSKDSSYEKFITMNSKWCNLDEYLGTGNINPSLLATVPFIKGRQNKDFILNRLLKKIFLPKTKKSFQKLGKPFGVIINDNLLKFHDNDIRKQVAKNII